MSDALLAGALAGLAAFSLPLGAVVSVVFRPPTRLVAIVMAFGSGALIHAVVTELAVHPATEMVAQHGYEAVFTWLVLAVGFLLGGLLYVGVNWLVERGGGGLHRRRRVRTQALEEKRTRAAPILEALSRSEIARCLSPDEAEEILPFLRRVEVRPGEVVFRRGDPSDALYLVERGAFEVRRNHGSPTAGHEAAEPGESVAVVGPGEAVGGLGMLGGQPRTTTLVARDAGALLTLTRADFDHVVSRLPRLRSVVADLVTRQLLASAHQTGASDPDEWQRIAVGSIQHLTRSEVEAAAEKRTAESSPLAIFIGALQDGIPESVAIGATFGGLASLSPTFLVAVFLSNLPEAVGGTSALLKTGFSVRRVLTMWAGLVVGSAVAGWIGYEALHGGPPAAIAFLGALAGGGVVAMLATTMMPEAYESGRAGVAPATIVGFLSSLFLAVLQIEAH